MSSIYPFVQKSADGIRIRIVVQPKSSKNMVAGVHGDALKIKITSPPVDGAANKACIRYLAKLFKTSKSSLSIVSGQTSRNKTVLYQPAGDTTHGSAPLKIIESVIGKLID